MMKPNLLYVIGAASGIAAGDPGCGDGPQVLQDSAFALSKDRIYWQAIIEPDLNSSTTKTQIIANFCQQIALQTKFLVENQKRFCVFGGDHACAIGTWSGVANAYRKQGAIGLIWIDAHLDSHTPETSESGNIHGMPVATLLGHGADALTHILQAEPKIAPENMCLIGIRSYESGEYELIRRLGVKVFYIDEVNHRGIKAIFNEALTHVQQRTQSFGISIDLDGIDPIEAPGVGTPESNGISGAELCELVKQLSALANFVGFEIAEFNPHRDIGKQTEKLAWELVKNMTNG